MLKNLYKGKFIVFEGLDGSGQSTQTKLLAEFLKEKGHKVLTTKEPTLDSVAGKKIRQILDEKTKEDPAKLQKLFAQDRKVHLNGLILPELKKGKIVISDRYCFSSFAFGSIAVPLNFLLKINDKFLMPDIIFFLDVKPVICLARMGKRNKDKTLFEEKNKMKKVYQNFKKILKNFKNSIIINGERNISQVHQEIKKYV